MRVTKKLGRVQTQKHTQLSTLVPLLQHSNHTLTKFKVVQPAFGCAQHPKAGRNTQQ